MTSNAINKLIDDIIRREGRETDDPSDSGGRTKYGISEKANPDLWVNGPPSLAQAHQRYLEKYVLPFEGIEDPFLLNLLVDWGVPTGPDTVIRHLQQIVGASIDGVVGPQTLAKVNGYPAGKLFGFPVPGSVRLNIAVRDARAMFHATTAKRRPKDMKYLLGWLARTFEFK